MRHAVYGVEPFSQVGAGVFKNRIFENGEVIFAGVAGKILRAGGAMIKKLPRSTMGTANAILVADFDKILDTGQFCRESVQEFEMVHNACLSSATTV